MGRQCDVDMSQRQVSSWISYFVRNVFRFIQDYFRCRPGVKSVLYQACSLYAMLVCNALSRIHNQLRISLIRVLEKALVKHLVKKFPESLQERTRFWIIS